MEITRDGDKIRVTFPALNVDKLSDADKARILAHIEEQKRPRSMSVRQSNGRGGSYDMVVGDETERLPTEENRWKIDGHLCLTTTAHVEALLGRRTSHLTGGPGA